MKMPNYNNHNSRTGVAILFAVLLVSIVLTVGLTLLNITLRQLILSSLARESQFAFYAADSARNCARHYDGLSILGDRPFGYFQLNPTSGALEYISPSVATLDCGDGILSGIAIDLVGTDPQTFEFTTVFDYADGRETCATVLITKYNQIGGTLDQGKTTIEARGYNNHDPGNSGGCYRVSDRTVERAASMVY